MKDNFELKEELVKQAQELVQKAENAPVYREVAELRKKWRRASSEEESFLDKELSDKFEEYLAQVKKISGDKDVSVEERKTAIIEEVKKLKESKNFKQASIKMNELLDAWKAAGRATKEIDDELWEQFKAARNEFYDVKNAYFENLRTTLAENKVKKEEIIAKAIEANETKNNFKELGDIMDGLMEEWKKSGRVAKEFEEDLWKQFNEQRQAFFKNRKEYFASMRETFAQRTEAKKELIKEAKLYLARGDFSKEEIDAIKALRTKWKEIGSAGKDNEDTLWEEFNNIVNKYYDNMRYYKK